MTLRVLVTGATGFIAGHLLPALAEGGHDVVALAHEPERAHAPAGVAVVEGDLRAPLDARRIGPLDAVVHLAQANVAFPERARDLFLVNVQGTAALLELAREAGAPRFVLASSGSVYGFGIGPVREHDSRRASDFYAVTKLAAELLVEPYRPYFGTTILRLFTPYGPGQTGRLIPTLIERVRAGRPVALAPGGGPRLTPIFVADVVDVVLAALERGGDGVVNVAGDEIVGIRELAGLIGEELGADPLFAEKDAARGGDLIGENTRMHSLYRPGPLVPLAEGLRATVHAETLA